MTCPDCQAASERQHHGYRSGCKGCQARAISRSPAFHESRRLTRQTATYRQMLKQFDITHDEVLRAAETDKSNLQRAIG